MVLSSWAPHAHHFFHHVFCSSESVEQKRKITELCSQRTRPGPDGFVVPFCCGTWGDRGPEVYEMKNASQSRYKMLCYIHKMNMQIVIHLDSNPTYFFMIMYSHTFVNVLYTFF